MKKSKVTKNENVDTLSTHIPLSKSNSPLLNIIFFKWEDASLYGQHTQSFGDIKNYSLMIGYVAGILVEETEVMYKVATDYFPDENTYRSVSVYPKSGVIKESVIIKEVLTNIT